MNRTVVKLGSSVVADERGQVRVQELEAFCDEVVLAGRDGRQFVVVTSGAIAHGILAMGMGARPQAIGELQAASAVGQGRLYQIYERLFRERGVLAAQVLLTFFDMSARSHYLNARQTLATLLEWGVLPVINENDTTTTDEITFGDNDFLAAQVAVLVAADELILLTDIDGLYTADPRVDPDAAPVASVADPAELQELKIGRTTSPLGSGGMRSKVLAAEMAMAAGIPTVICNGLDRRAVADALTGRPVGTRFAAGEARYNSFKLWLKYAKPARGEIVVDAGAARAVRETSASLLPVGIVAVNGDFDAGDAVSIAGPGATPLAKGITTYSAQELRAVAGLNSAQLRDRLPGAAEEAVHRDYLVLE
ncbi:MAG TPA: glutamate 5-kinase [Solirubrobacteraceae bacterium]|nr:glutamate 5-kinase [Solirubrobacteraceae bacterium]